MSGPLVRVNTTVAGINLDVSRLLNMGKGITLEFIVPDQTEVSNWRVLLTLTKGFDRIVQDEKTKEDGSDVIIHVADLAGNLGPIVRSTDLHIRLEGQIYKVAKTPPVASNEVQVFKLMCKTLVLRNNFDSRK